jgi:hypothetical protein
MLWLKLLDVSNLNMLKNSTFYIYVYQLDHLVKLKQKGENRAASKLSVSNWDIVQATRQYIGGQGARGGRGGGAGKEDQVQVK